MKLRKLALVLVIVLMASALTPAFAKNPFADVPADHWAYDSVVELAAAGLVEGYPDGTFGGARMMTRYEAAMVFARALHRLEAQIAEIDVLPELDKIKAELMAEIKAQMAALDKPVVETKIVERVIDKSVDEETLARIRAAEIAAESLDGDIAYLEARVLGLLDGIRYDVNKLQGQVNGLEIPSTEEIEALIAAKVQEGLLSAALGAKEVVKETTIVERVVSETPELTEADVEAIAEALILKQLQKYDILVRENRDFIIGLFDRVDEIEGKQAEVDARLAALEKVKFSGSYKFEAKQDIGKDFAFTQTGTLNVNIKASDSTNVKAFLGFNILPGSLEIKDNKLTNYGLEVTSKTPISRLVVGKVNKDDVAGRFSPYVLATTEYDFAGLADLDIIPGLTANVLLARKNATNVRGAFGMKYAFIPELGIKAAVVADKDNNVNPALLSVGAGLFGKVAGVNYTGDFAMDFDAKEDNMLFAAKADTTIAGLKLDGSFALKQANYKINNPFVNTTNKYSFELGAGYDQLLGINFAGRYYHEASAAGKNIGAFKVDASKKFDFFVPVTVSAVYANNTTGTNEAVQHTLAKVAFEKKPALGLSYGASATYVNNELTDGAWKNATKFTVKDAAIFTADLGYKLNWSGALVSLGYGANFRLPIEPKTDSKVLTHTVSLGYDFTSNVKLTLGGTVKQTLGTPVVNNFGYNAGLSVSF